MAITYYGTATADATTPPPTISTGSEGNNTLERTEPGPSSLTSTIGGGQVGPFWTFTSVQNDPGFTTWVSGSYIGQVNVSLLGADVTYELYLDRVNDAGVKVERLATSITYSASAVNTLTWNNGTDKSVTSTDRFQLGVTGRRAASHGNQDLTIEVGTGDSNTTKLLIPTAVAAATRRIFFIT